MIIEDIPIYIVHYKKLIERKEYLNQELKSYGFRNIIWIQDIDRDHLTEEHENMYRYDENQWNKICSSWREYNSKPRQLTKSEIACTVSHAVIYKDIFEKNIQMALIFEDDVVLYNDFKNRLENVIKSLPDNFDSCYLSDNFGWTVDNYKYENGCGYLGYLNKNKYSSDKLVYKMTSGKCTDSYLISNNCAKQFVKDFIPFSLPSDWMHNGIYILNNMNVYWCEPAITHAGSDDVYSSSLREEVKNITNEVKKEIKLNELTKEIKLNELTKEIKLNELTQEKIIEYSKIKGEVKDLSYMYLEQYSKRDLEKFTEWINTSKNFTMIKYGDGEFRNMISENENEHNCDNCNYFKDLGLDLIRSYIDSLTDKNTYINKWHSHYYEIQNKIENDYSNYFQKDSKFLFFDLIVHKLNEKGTFKEEQINFFRAIKNSPRKKIYISNMNMIKALHKILGIKNAVAIPEVNSYLKKNEILERLEKILLTEGSNCIVLFSAGMCGKVINTEIRKKFPNNTYIDIGSTFDGLIKYSRDFNAKQGYRDSLLKVYSD